MLQRYNNVAFSLRIRARASAATKSRRLLARGPGKPKELKVNTKFDFVPGDKLLFFDDFSNDFIGDFPSKWDTNGTGEVVTFNETTDKWFEFTQAQRD